MSCIAVINAALLSRSFKYANIYMTFIFYASKGMYQDTKKEGDNLKWCVRADSNCRPPPCQGGTLTN